MQMDSYPPEADRVQLPIPLHQLKCLFIKRFGFFYLLNGVAIIDFIVNKIVNKNATQW